MITKTSYMVTIEGLLGSTPIDAESPLEAAEDAARIHWHHAAKVKPATRGFYDCICSADGRAAFINVDEVTS